MLRNVSLALLAIACASPGFADVGSLRGLVSESSASVVFEPALIGKWSWDVEIARDGKNGYKVTIGDSKLTMRLVNIYGVLIGDLKDEKTPFHAFVKLEIETDSFKVWFFDSGWLEQEIQNRGWPRHEVVDGDVVLTATEEELRRDLPAYLVDPRSWKDEETLERIK